MKHADLVKVIDAQNSLRGLNGAETSTLAHTLRLRIEESKRLIRAHQRTGDEASKYLTRRNADELAMTPDVTKEKANTRDYCKRRVTELSAQVRTDKAQLDRIAGVGK